VTKLPFFGLLPVACLAASAIASDAGPQPGSHLQLEAKIPLGEVKGRIDHLTLDLRRGRLFVAELGNDTVGVVDLKQRRVVRRLSGFKEPQGLAWSAEADTLYVASGGDGTVRAFTGEALAIGATIDLGDDADNIRLGPDGQVLVGFGSGALATLDARTLRRGADIRFPGHPEAFQLEKRGSRVFINVPDAREVVVLDRGRSEVSARWHMDFGANYPMALDEVNARLFVVFRSPAMLGLFSTRDGGALGQFQTCADADDVFLDESRSAVYVICGAGRVEAFDSRTATFKKTGVFQSATGARTGLFSPELDRLFIAVRASGSEPAAIWVLRPTD
jgi:DNA-binding beta-propeller fold protein YncE